MILFNLLNVGGVGYYWGCIDVFKVLFMLELIVKYLKFFCLVVFKLIILECLGGGF